MLVGATIVILAIAFLAGYDVRQRLRLPIGDGARLWRGARPRRAARRRQAYSHAQQLMPSCTDPLAGLALEAIARAAAAVAEALMYALRVDGAPVRTAATRRSTTWWGSTPARVRRAATTMPTPPNCNRVDHHAALPRVHLRRAAALRGVRPPDLHP